MSFPFNPIEIGINYLNTFIATYLRTIQEQRMKKEAQLQLDVARPPAPQAEEKRLVTRLVHNAPALRPFLEHNQPLTALSDNPLVHAAETDQARHFIRDFQLVEHSLLHTMKIPFSTWQADSYREDLSRTLSQNSELYQQVAGFTRVPEPERKAVVARLALELQAGQDKKRSAASQME